MDKSELKIIGWTNWDNDKYPEIKLNSLDDRTIVMESVAEELRKNKYRWSGYYHQRGEGGVPVFDFDGGVVFKGTLRLWGSIMALAYSDEIDNSDGMGYCDWAWGDSLEPKYPDKDYILV